jgi:hypothetical protein
MKKGQGPLQWVFIVLILTLIILVFIASPLGDAVNEGIKRNIRIQLDEITGIIDTLETSPDTTIYTGYTLMDIKCTAEFRNGMVIFNVKIANDDLIFSKSWVQRNDIQVIASPQKIECGKRIVFEKSNGVIRITPAT